MGREVRRVPPDWQHPKDEITGKHIPLMDGAAYRRCAEAFMGLTSFEALQDAIDNVGVPDKNDYMPEWTPEEATHFMMYEDTSEGTPISPAFATPEELAKWLADTGASSSGSMTATYEQWLRVAKGGYAPSAVYTPSTGLVSGVQFD